MLANLTFRRGFRAQDGKLVEVQEALIEKHEFDALEAKLALYERVLAIVKEEAVRDASYGDDRMLHLLDNLGVVKEGEDGGWLKHVQHPGLSRHGSLFSKTPTSESSGSNPDTPTVSSSQP